MLLDFLLGEIFEFAWGVVEAGIAEFVAETALAEVLGVSFGGFEFFRGKFAVPGGDRVGLEME